MTFGACRLAPIASQHDAILNLITLAFNPLKEAIDTFPFPIAMPEQVFLLLRKVTIRGMNWEVDIRRIADKMRLPFRHLLPFPADHGILINRQLLVRHHDILVDADDAAIALATRASPVRVVEAEEVRVRLLEQYPIRLESIGEQGDPMVARRILRRCILHHHHFTRSPPLEECRLHRLRHTRDLVVVAMPNGDSVNKEVDV